MHLNSHVFELIEQLISHTNWNGGEMKNVTYLVVFLGCFINGGVDAWPTSASACFGEDLIFRISGIKGELTNCTVKNRQGVYFQLFPPDTNPGKNASRVTYFDSGVEGERCGFRLNGVKNEDKGEWNLTATSSMGSSWTRASIGGQECPKGDLEKKYELLPGERANEACAPEGMKVCYARRPDDRSDSVPPHIQEGGQSEVCFTDDRPFNNLVAGKWKCNWALPGSIMQRSTVAELSYHELIGDDIGVKWINSTTDGKPRVVNVWCNLAKKYPLLTCRFTQPGGKVFYPADGLAYGRYSYYGNGTSEGSCGLSIQQPLDPGDIGVWRCEIFVKSPVIVRGGYLEVGVEKRSVDAIAMSLRPWSKPVTGGEPRTVTVVAGNSLTVGCSVNASLTFCIIRHPNGTNYIDLSEGSDNGDYAPYGWGNRVGDCGIQVTKAQLGDTGTWKCVVGIDHSDAREVPIDVKVHELEVIAESTLVMRGLPSAVTCRTVTGVAMERCVFERPDGTMLSVIDSRHPDAQRTTWRYGVKAVSNMSTGICKLSIPSMRERDIGQWTCIVKMEGYKDSMEIKFEVRDVVGLQSASAGVISAIVLTVAVILAVGGAVGYKMYQRRRNRVMEINPRVSGTVEFSANLRRESDEASQSSGNSEIENRP